VIAMQLLFLCNSSTNRIFDKIMKLLLFPFLLLAGQISYGQHRTDSSFGKSILTYTVYDPWSMFMGADGPLLAVCESGKVIFWKDREYKFVEFNVGEKDELINEMNLSDTFFLKSKSIQATRAQNGSQFELLGFFINLFLIITTLTSGIKLKSWNWR
jgi:hypothetical protein